MSARKRAHHHVQGHRHERRGPCSLLEGRALAQQRPGAVLGQALAVVLDSEHAVEDQEDLRARFALLVHHTDAEGEWAYDRESPLGKLDKALDEAQAKGWIVVDMKNDWKTIFPFGNK